LLDYLVDLVDSKRRTPGDDLISRLYQRGVRTGALSRDDLVDIVRLLLVNGFETTANMISLAVVLLLSLPQSPAELGLGLPRDGLEASADTRIALLVDELLRHQTIVHIAPTRAVLEDIILHGKRIRAGEGVITSLAAANRDPAVFDDPDTFRPDRETNRHLSFGFGSHYCLGHPLVRLEMSTVLSALFRRAASLRLAVPLHELRFKHNMGIYGVHELPVTW